MRTSKFVIIFAAALSVFGCQKSLEVKPSNAETSKTPAAEQPVATPSSANISAKVEVSKLANRSIAEIDNIFGAPADTNDVENGGKYRLYKFGEYQKGLAIRFYDGKARSFNLILDQPAADSKSAIYKNLGIDVGNAKPSQEKTEPLTESYQGAFGGVKFAKVAAKTGAGRRIRLRFS